MLNTSNQPHHYTKSKFSYAIKVGLIFAVILSTFFSPNYLTLADTSGGNTYYVSLAGSDSNPGTLSQPWKTIQKAANAMLAGDTLIVQAGTYTNQRVNISLSGSSGKPITYQASGKVVMKGFNIQASFINIQGFEIAFTEYQRWNRSLGAGIYIKGSNNNIENNYIHDAALIGIMIFGSTSQPTISSNNIIRNNRLFHNELIGIDVSGRNNTIENNDISSTVQCHPTLTAVENNASDNPNHLACPNYPGVSGLDADGIRFFGQGHIFKGNNIHDIVFNSENITPHIDCFQTWSDGASYETASNIVFAQNSCTNLNKGMYAFTLDGGANNLTIQNNIIKAFGGINSSSTTNHLFIYNNLWINDMSFGSQGNPIGIVLRAPYSIAKNNIFYNQPYQTIIAIGDTTGTQVDYNLAYNSDGSNADCFRVGDWVCANPPPPHNEWNVNPQFIDPSSGNFHQSNNSPLIDSGIELPVTIDYDNHLRPEGNGYDIGPYEYVFTVAPTATLNPTNTSTPLPTNTPTSIPTNTPTSLPTNTPTSVPTFTNTAIPATATSNPPTATSIPPTATAQPSATPAPTMTVTQNPPFPQPTATATEIPATSQPTFTITPTLPILPPTITVTSSLPTSQPTATIAPSQCANCTTADSGWPMLRDNTTNDARSSYNGPSQPVKNWSYTSGAIKISAPVLDSSDNLYLGVNSSLVSLSSKGEKLWAFSTNGVVTSPLLTSGNTLYFGSGDGKVYSVTTQGALKWTYQTGGPITASPNIASDGTLYIPSNDGKLYALTQSGILKWAYATGSTIRSSPAIANDGIFFGAANGKLYALDSSGSLRWTYQTSGSLTTSPSIYSDGTVFIGSGDGRLYAISAAGIEKWTALIGGTISSPALGVDGTVYVGSSNGRLNAYSLKGSRKWTFKIGVSVSSPVISQNGTIFSGSEDGTIYAISSNGSLVWKLKMGATGLTDAAIGSQGALYASAGGTIYSIVNKKSPTGIGNIKIYLPGIYYSHP